MPNRFQRLDQYEHIEILGDGKIEWKRASAVDKSLMEMRVLGDTEPRFQIRVDGQIGWGPGDAALDSFLGRGGLNRLGIANNLWINEGYLEIFRAGAGAFAFDIHVTGDTDYRLVMLTDGQIEWGSGAAGRDCQLSRRAADILNTPDRMEVGTLGVGNSLAATTPGDCQKKIEVFDDAGASIGFLPVYDAIT